MRNGSTKNQFAAAVLRSLPLMSTDLSLLSSSSKKEMEVNILSSSGTLQTCDSRVLSQAADACDSQCSPPSMSYYTSWVRPANRVVSRQDLVLTFINPCPEILKFLDIFDILECF